MFKNFPAIDDQYQYVESKINSYSTSEISQNKPQSYTALYSRKRYVKYLEKFPNVPFQFLYELKNNNGQHSYNIKENENIIYNERNINKLFNITINNQYWQEYISRRGIFYLYNAYLDTRGKYSYIQIIAIAEKAARNDVHKCAIWYKNSSDPDISLEPMKMNPINLKRLHEAQLFIGNQNSVPNINNMAFYVLTCKILNRRNRIPQAVSIVDHKHTYKNSDCYAATNYLKVNHNYEEKKDFAVCVKAYFFQKSHVTKLIEWIELLSILGAKKIFLYELEGNPDVWKVFDSYIRKGILDVTKCTIPGDPNFRNTTYLKMHLRVGRTDGPIFLNDCLYRNIYKYKFIVNTDIDEVIVPRELGHTWSDMMASFLTMYKNASSYFFRNTYYFDDVPEYTPLLNGALYDVPKTNHMLRHVYRSKNLKRGKSILNTELVKVVTGHQADKCTFNPCKEAIIEPTVALVHHYRKGCQDGVKNCYEAFRKDIILDTRLWEFKDKLISRSNETLSKLDMDV